MSVVFGWSLPLTFDYCSLPVSFDRDAIVKSYMLSYSIKESSGWVKSGIQVQCLLYLDPMGSMSVAKSPLQQYLQYHGNHPISYTSIQAHNGTSPVSGCLNTSYVSTMLV